MSPDLANNWPCADNARTTFPKENMFTATCSCGSVFLKGLSACSITDSETANRRGIGRMDYHNLLLKVTQRIQYRNLESYNGHLDIYRS